MNRARLSIGVVLVLVGMVWVVQGVGATFAPESQMTDEPTWVVIGALVALAGIGLIWWSRKANEPEVPSDEER